MGRISPTILYFDRILNLAKKLTFYFDSITSDVLFFEEGLREYRKLIQTTFKYGVMVTNSFYDQGWAPRFPVQPESD